MPRAAVGGRAHAFMLVIFRAMSATDGRLIAFSLTRAFTGPDALATIAFAPILLQLEYFSFSFRWYPAAAAALSLRYQIT